MGRQLRTTLPQAPDHMKPEWPYLEKFRVEDVSFKLRQKANFDKRHQVRPLPVIADGTDVWITTDRADPVPGVIVKKSAAPRSYLIDTESGAVRRNRCHLNVVPKKEDQHPQGQDESSDREEHDLSPPHLASQPPSSPPHLASPPPPESTTSNNDQDANSDGDSTSR